jgi:hypothetical protein
MTKRKPTTERRRPADDAERSAVEACQLLGFGNNPNRLCASDRLKVDLVSTLRLVIDHAGQVALEGGTADIGRLVGAVEQLTKLLPKAATEPAPSRDDPNSWRSQMWETYQAMRARGAAAGQGYDGLVLENERLRAEVAALKAGGAGKPVDDDVPTMVERVPAPAANVVPLSRPNPPAVPAYDYNTQRGWRDHVLPDGSIRT